MNKGIIYIIKCKDKNIRDCYIGSTTNLKNRMKQHKSDCNNENCEKYNNKKYKFIRENGGFDNFYFKILENEIEFNNRKELNKIERYYIEEFKSNLNSELPGRTRKEYYQNNKQKKKEYKKNYYENNKDKIKEYYQKNKHEVLKNRKEHYNINKKHIREYATEYYNKHKKIINEKKKIKITCECNSIIRKTDYPRHKKTIKHLDFINNKLFK